MHQGYIVELGDANDIYQNPIHPYTRALLTAIPQPDPHSKDDRIKIVYDKGDINYEENTFIEVSPLRYVLGNEELIKEWMKK
jgi:oligopeptide transport system ATP-binding protein